MSEMSVAAGCHRDMVYVIDACSSVPFTSSSI